MQRSEKLEAIASDTAFALVDQLTSELRALADASDWPAEVVSRLNVEWDGTNISVTYPSEIATLVENLEYGTESDRPNSVIRAFTYRCVPTVQAVLANRTMPQLMDAEGLFL